MDKYWRKKIYGKVSCLVYHRVDDPKNNLFLTKGGSPVIPPDELEKELRFLIRQGVVFLTFKDLRNGHFPGPSEIGIMICFDDCFQDNYTVGYEVLNNLNIKGTFFQTTGLIDSEKLIWEHALYWYSYHEKLSKPFYAHAYSILNDFPCVKNSRERELLYILREKIPLKRIEDLLVSAQTKFNTADEIAEASKNIYPQSLHIKEAYLRGHEIGSHGHNHYKRVNIDGIAFEEDLKQSSEILERIIGVKPRIFSYPFDSYTNGDARICARYFSQVAVGERKYIVKNTDPMHLPRFTWHGIAKNQLRFRRWLLTGKI